MSKSRLEKFLYALYTLNHDELPIPSSRLETLYNCLVTGEEPPSFTPLSRVEKYLMAILGVYDIGLLPKPLSRIEILLSKLVNGEELGEVDEFLSKHEELLAGIIQQGGLESGNFIEVLVSINTSFTTLYNTAKKSIKSAVLEGQTLVDCKGNQNTNYAVDDLGYYTLTGSGIYKTVIYNQSMLKPNTTYTLLTFIEQNTLNGEFRVHVTHTTSSLQMSTSAIVPLNGVGLFKHILTTPTDLSLYEVGIRTSVMDTATDGVIKFRHLLIEGDYTDIDIPYFEGMQSVKMPVLTTTGKNLFDYKDYGGYDTNVVEIENGLRVSGWAVRLPFTHNLLPNTIYTSKSVVRITEEHVGAIDIAPGKIMMYNGTTYLPLFGENGVEYTFKTPSDINSYDMILFYAHGGGGGKVGVVEVTNMQLEKGSTATSYEPYKSNILTVNEEVELGSIGNVRDELNLLTGELTQKTTESYINNFTANWYVGLNGDLSFYIYKRIGRMSGSDFTCDKLPVCLTPTINASYECLAKGNYEFGDIIMYIPQNNITTLDEAVQRLNSYNAKIRYVLNEPNIKTVDLSIVDQDGEDTKLSSFDDITHVITSSEGLIPGGSIEVIKRVQFVEYSLDNEVTTAYNTIEYPVKSASLKGNTLVNLCENSNVTKEAGRSTSTPARYSFVFLDKTKDYDVYFDVSDSNNDGTLNVTIQHWSSGVGIPNSNGRKKVKIISTMIGEDFSGISFYFISADYDGGARANVSNIVVVESNSLDIPYFEGMTSVKMPVLTTTGKNLLDTESLVEGVYWSATGHFMKYEKAMLSEQYIRVKPSTSIYFSHPNVQVLSYDINKKFIKRTQCNAIPYLVTDDVAFIRLSFYNTETYDKNIMVTMDETPSPYVPFKSNILTTSEEVELRGIGDVKDELDLLSGKLTQRIGEVVLDGSEDWRTIAVGRFYIKSLLTNIVKRPTQGVVNFKCDKLKPIPYVEEYSGEKGICIFKNNDYDIIVRPGVQKVDEFKQWLSQNPVTVQYLLVEEAVKTVDLSIVDQDGEDTKLSSFDDITHITTSSEGLIPGGSIEVATKNMDDVVSINTMSLHMDDISSRQGEIDKTVNEQTDMTSTTMLGVTEIYEEIL